REPHFRSVVHHQTERHGHGSAHLPLDRRSPWRTAMGVAGFLSRRPLSIHRADCHDGGSRMTGERTAAHSVVFVIDDDDALREAPSSLLRSVGLSVELFASADEFLASKLPDVPSCLVLDVRLPGLSGLDFQAELTKANIQVPIIFITGHGDIPMTVRAMKA